MLPLDILSTAVQLTTIGAKPRPGQAHLCTDLAVALEKRSHLAAIAPTGSGKSYALLAAAAYRVVEHGERVLLSTASLSLQTQVLDKDAPIVVEAVRRLGGPTVKVAVLKGVNNYIDPRKLISTAHTFLGEDKEQNLKQLIDAVGRSKPTAASMEAFEGVDWETLKRLVVWGLEQYLDPNSSGDRHSCPLQHSADEWAHVSAMAAEAAGEDDGPHFPKALAARLRVAAADIVVTNHVMLAIQAANSIPIVLGNGNLGQFDHILIDEAHDLPDEVRKQGAAEVSGRKISSFIRAVRRLSDEGDRQLKKWCTDGEALAELLETALRARLGHQDVYRVGKDEDPLGDVGVVLAAWVKRGVKFAEPASKSPDVKTMLKGRRAKASGEEMVAAIHSVSTFRGGEARWVEAPPKTTDSKYRAWVSAQSSPVDVSGRISRNLWFLPSESGNPDDSEPLGVGCVSATLPQGFTYQAGLSTTLREYESPFAAAYGRSFLFIPQATSPKDVDALSREMYGRRQFDTKKHPLWAGPLIVDLVTANRGSALVLAATSAAGRLYADTLKRSGIGEAVHSQWDGETPARMLSRWRDDPGAVLVGTRSLMTGVDAPGETCSLVILDRIPRLPSNPIDDAQVELLTEKLGDKWAADRLVYASAAALRAEQAAGRLIRAVSDSGMVAVLDPRLLQVRGANAVFTYPEPTRRIYMKPLYKFSARTSVKEEALAWLRNRREAMQVA